MLTRNRVEEVLNAFPGKTVVVLGDFMVDEFVWGKVRRISPEAPVPVVEVTGETYRLGGAGNVAGNIRAADGKPIPIGIVGNDRAAALLLDEMRNLGIETDGILRDDRPTTLKTRILAHNQQIARADRESRAVPGAAVNAGLADAFERALSTAQAVVISDYDKGVVNRELMRTILPRAKAAGVPVFLDPKVPHADYYHPITLIKPNHSATELLAGMSIDGPASLEQAGQRLLAKFECDYALITRGEEGMSLFSRNSTQHLPTFAREVFDVTGAGDTVIAMLALAKAAGAATEEAAVLANHAAGIVVGKIGTASVSRAELLADFDARNAHSTG
jgi:D-beta-D-heptose 7-phosphate kinase/D-beta-D-heptose 1-phosphate adenosyltransferase